MVKSHWVKAAAFILPVVLLTTYVGCYLWLGEVHNLGDAKGRQYEYPWLAKSFIPAARVESIVTGEKVQAGSVINRTKYGGWSAEYYP